MPDPSQIPLTPPFCNRRSRGQPPNTSSWEVRRLSPLSGRPLVGMAARRPPTGCNIQGACLHRR